jgi:hypothetical protein
MAESAVEGATGLLGMAPGQGKSTLGYSTSGNREVHLAVGQREEDAGIGTERAEEVDLVVPRPGVAEREVAGWLGSTTSMVKSWVQGWPSKRAPITDPNSGQVWQASVAECTPSTAR